MLSCPFFSFFPSHSLSESELGSSGMSCCLAVSASNFSSVVSSPSSNSSESYEPSELAAYFSLFCFLASFLVSLVGLISRYLFSICSDFSSCTCFFHSTFCLCFYRAFQVGNNLSPDPRSLPDPLSHSGASNSESFDLISKLNFDSISVLSVS